MTKDEGPGQGFEQCKTCAKQPHEVNHPVGMMFVGFGLGWQPCSSCGGAGKIRSKTVWGYSHNESPGSWDGACATREEAIGDGRDIFGDEPFYIVEGEWILPESLVSATEIIFGMEDKITDEGPEEAELTIKPGGVEALDELLENWCREYVGGTQYWRQTGNSERIEKSPKVCEKCGRIRADSIEERDDSIELICSGEGDCVPQVK